MPCIARSASKFVMSCVRTSCCLRGLGAQARSSLSTTAALCWTSAPKLPHRWQLVRLLDCGTKAWWAQGVDAECAGASVPRKGARVRSWGAREAAPRSEDAAPSLAGTRDETRRDLTRRDATRRDAPTEANYLGTQTHTRQAHGKDAHARTHTAGNLRVRAEDRGRRLKGVSHGRGSGAMHSRLSRTVPRFLRLPCAAFGRRLGAARRVRTSKMWHSSATGPMQLTAFDAAIPSIHRSFCYQPMRSPVAAWPLGRSVGSPRTRQSAHTHSKRTPASHHALALHPRLVLPSHPP